MQPATDCSANPQHQHTLINNIKNAAAAMDAAYAEAHAGERQHPADLERRTACIVKSLTVIRRDFAELDRALATKDGEP